MRAELLAALIIASVAASAQAVMAQQPGEECVIDPVPYEKLLAEVMEKMSTQDWGGVRELLAIAERARPCSPELLSRHRDLYESLAELSNLLERASSLEDRFGSGDTEGLRDEVREVYNGLDALRQEVYDRVISYTRFLGRFAEDKASFFEYSLRIGRDLDTLKGVVSLAMERLAKIYIALTEGGSGEWLDISVSLPRRVYAGDEVGVTVLVKPSTAQGAVTNVSEVRVRVSLIVSYALEASNETVTGVGTNTTVYIKAPDTAAMDEKGVELIRLAGGIQAALAKVTVTAESLDGGVTGFAVRSTYVYAMQPPIEYYVPPYAEVNGTLSVRVSSHAVTPVNVSVYLDEVGNETLLTNATIYPGYSLMNVSLANVSAGYHKVLFVTQPAGRYVSITKSAAVVVGSPNIPVTVNVPLIVLVPPYMISVGGELGEPIGEYDVSISVGGEEAYRSSLASGTFRAVLSLPAGLPTLFIGRVRVRIDVIPHNPAIKPTEYAVDVVVVNVLSTLVVVGVTGALYMHPRTSAALASLMRAVLVRRVGAGQAKQALISRAWVFRPFRLRRYYAALIRLLSRFVPPPEPHETLREYAARAVARLPRGVVALVEWLIMLFEQDLYSSKPPDAKEAGELVRAVEEGIGKEVGEG